MTPITCVPCLCEMPNQTGPVLRENLRADFSMSCGISGLDEAIRSHNAVGGRAFPRPSSRSTWREAERFPVGDGIGTAASPMSNIGPLRCRDRRRISAAKKGDRRRGGRQASDSWKAYMRRAHQHDKLWNRAAACAGREVSISSRASASTRSMTYDGPWASTAGIAVIIFASQIKGAFRVDARWCGSRGLFFRKNCRLLWRHAPSFEPAAVAIFHGGRLP